MNQDINKDDLEKKAAQAHQIWAHWMNYFFGQYLASAIVGLECAVFVVPMQDYSRWYKQVSTRYEDLTEKEKDSDREIAKQYLMEKE